MVLNKSRHNKRIDSTADAARHANRYVSLLLYPMMNAKEEASMGRGRAISYMIVGVLLMFIGLCVLWDSRGGPFQIFGPRRYSIAVTDSIFGIICMAAGVVSLVLGVAGARVDHTERTNDSRR